jgi:single-stranded-DNA-specific exonuclease
VIGIVASRLVDRFGKPVVLIAASQGGVGRGSARSVEGVNITAAIGQASDFLLGYGGHLMAAGISIELARIPEFRRTVSRAVQSQIGDAAIVPGLQIDAYQTLDELSLDLAEELERLAPFGPGNPPLTLATRNLALKRTAAMGRGDEHLALTVEDELGGTRRVLWWQGGSAPLPEALSAGRFDLAFHLRASNFGGQRDVQLEWVDFRPVAEPAIVITTPQGEGIDCRSETRPLVILKKILAQERSAQVWSEGGAKTLLAEEGILGRGRNELEICETLVIWTSPPGRPELLAVLAKACPRRVVLFGIDPSADTPEIFLKRLAGLVKYTLTTNGGSARVSELAAAMAQREAAVRLGLTWLASRGHIQTQSGEGDEWILMPGNGQTNPAEANRLMGQLRTMLEEISAYRAYFHRADINSLLHI